MYNLKKACFWLMYSRPGDAVFGAFTLTMAIITFLIRDEWYWLVVSGCAGVVGALCLLNAIFDVVRVDWRTKR